MEIKNVQLQVLAEVKEGEMQDGLPLPTRPETINFLVDVEGEGADVVVPVDPRNAHYWEVKAWYDAQEAKPFEFSFEEMAEPSFEETIYPELPEQEDVSQDQLTLPVTTDEPETLMPK